MEKLGVLLLFWVGLVFCSSRLRSKVPQAEGTESLQVRFLSGAESGPRRVSPEAGRGGCPQLRSACTARPCAPLARTVGKGQP